MSFTLLLASLLLSAAQAGEYRVVGGHVAAPGAWPDAAAISFGNGVGCTGVLVAPDVVLTAGHCVGGIRRVYLDTVDYSVSTGVSVRVLDEIEYPSSWGSYDIAVLLLEEAVTTIAPRIIAQDCILDDYLHDGSPVAIVGFGMIDEWGTVDTTQLHEAFTTVTDHDCSDTSTGCFSGVSPGGEIGAGGGGIDACYGDSGGPLYLQTVEGDFLIGLTSRAYDGVDKPCEEGGIYVRPDAVVSWIESVSGRTLQRPACDGLPPQSHPPAPSAEAITVMTGDTGYTEIIPNDPDTWQAHTFAVLTPPEHVEATLYPTGNLAVHATPGYVGDDEIVIVVTETGPEALTGTVTIPITVLPNEADLEDDTDEDFSLGTGGCACNSTTGAPLGLLGLVGLLGLTLRRRR